MKNLFLLSFLFFFYSIYGQQELSQEKIKNNIEDFILQKKIDSANYYLTLLKKSDYKLILEKIVSKNKLNYQEQYKIISSLSDRPSVNYAKISNFIDEIVKTPESKKFNEDYFKIKCDQTYNLRNDVSVEKASEKYNELEDYLSNFKEKDISIQKARLRIQTHPIVLYLIEKDIEKGKKLVLDCLEKSKQLNDIELEIMFLYHLTDFLVLEGKLQEYIEVSEKSLALENQIPEKSPYYHAILRHLIDAYIFKGGYNDKVILLIDELYSDSTYHFQSYILYLKFLANPSTTIKEKEDILKKFQVTDVKELVEKLKFLGKDLNQNDFYKLLYEGSKALENHGFLKEAIVVKDESVVLTRKIYSQDLSKSLADFKIEQTVKSKQKEIEHEQEKNKLYLVIIILGSVFFIISLLIIRKIMTQSKELIDKNKFINKTLKEKELLIQEVHHRVKNNFQIVASLLELQTQGITDEKALELINEGKNRIKSMALVHQKLYQNENGLIDFNEYLRLICKELTSVYSLKNNIKIEIDSENIFFGVDTAIPLGLIINEIITNAYKYAFSVEKENKLFISIHEIEDHFQLIIQDNGAGIPENFDVKTAKSLGLRLINRLVKQLYGTLHQINDNGARFEINFKDNSKKTDKPN